MHRQVALCGYHGQYEIKKQKKISLDSEELNSHAGSKKEWWGGTPHGMGFHDFGLCFDKIDGFHRTSWALITHFIQYFNLI